MKVTKHISTWVYGVLIIILLGILFFLFQYQSRLSQARQQTQIQQSEKKRNVEFKQQTALNYTDFTAAEHKEAANLSITIVGDSITKGAEGAYKQIFKKAVINAKVNRRVEALPAILTDLKARNAVADTVLIGLGTNGPITNSMLAGIMEQLGTKRKIYWINTHVPTRDWEQSVNQTLANAANQYQNLEIIDWHNYSLEQSSWFYEDNIHPNKLGRSNLIQLVTKTILEN